MTLAGPLIDVASARSFLRAVVPEWEWFVGHLESQKGLVRFPRQLTTIIRNLKIEAYPLLYENEASISLVLARGFMDRAELAEMDRQVTAASPQERGEIMQAFVCELNALETSFELPKTPADERRAQEAFNRMTPAEQSESVLRWQRLMMGFLATFYQHLSMMVHGEKLTALVAQAKLGDSTAFAKAVQIDKRILTTIPYFKDRHALVGMESDMDFLQEIGRRIGAPPYRGRIRHKSLWLTFALLEACSLLDTFGHEELLDLCDDVGVGGYKSRVTLVPGTGAAGLMVC